MQNGGENMAKGQKLADKTTTLTVILSAILFMLLTIGLNLYFGQSASNTVRLLLALFMFVPGSELLWLVDQNEKHNDLVNNWVMLTVFCLAIVMLFTWPMIKHSLIIIVSIL